MFTEAKAAIRLGSHCLLHALDIELVPRRSNMYTDGHCVLVVKISSDREEERDRECCLGVLLMLADAAELAEARQLAKDDMRNHVTGRGGRGWFSEAGGSHD